MGAATRVISKNIAYIRHSPLQGALGLLLLLLAIASVLVGFRNAQLSSIDLQWHPQVVFWRDHLDPYQQFLLLKDGRNSHVVPPLNLQLTVFLLAPMGFMSVAAAKLFWSLANISFLALIYWCFTKTPQLRMPVAVFLIFLCSASIRAVVSNGQITLLCLACYALYVYWADSRPRLAAMFAGAGAIKYSLGAPLFFQLPLHWRNVIWFASLPLAALVYWCVHFHISPLAALLEPIKVASSIGLAGDGTGDLVLLAQTLGANTNLAYAAAGLTLVGLAVFQKLCLPTQNRLHLFSFYTLIALWAVYHRVYDFVFLLPVAIMAVHTSNRLVRYGLMAGCLYFWFVMTALQRAAGIVVPPAANLLLLLAMQALVAIEMHRAMSVLKNQQQTGGHP